MTKGSAARGADTRQGSYAYSRPRTVVTCSSAGRARISLKHGLGSTKTRRSRLAAACSILPHLCLGGWVQGVCQATESARGLSLFSSASLTLSVIALETLMLFKAFEAIPMAKWPVEPVRV